MSFTRNFKQISKSNDSIAGENGIMNEYRYFNKSIKMNWYTQGFNAVPLFLNLSALSGFGMKKILGYGYRMFILDYRKGYGEMSYLYDDFDKIWMVIKKRISADPKYLIKTKKLYEDIFERHIKTFRRVDSLKISDISDNELLKLFKELCYAQTDSVGIAHLLDPVGLKIEKDFKKKLFEEIKDKNNFNKYYTLLTSPTRPSFMAIEDRQLQKIARDPRKTKNANIKKHLRKYFWIQNSYAGPQKLTSEFFRKRLSTARKTDCGIQNLLQAKNRLIRKDGLSGDIWNMIKIIDFAAGWQDERKRNILKTIGYLGKAAEEMSRRTKIPVNTFYYFGAKEALNFKTLEEIKKFRKEIFLRTEGVLFIMEDGKEFFATNRLYKKIKTSKEKISKSSFSKQGEIHGSIANGGTAVGKVIICNNLSLIYKVKDNDILVTSMTRPEFMPALKKASAIITDEGGLTCHAAIIARELNIPCVVGAKVATKLLKDGMIVEVKANHGVVKILKRN